MFLFLTNLYRDGILDVEEVLKVSTDNIHRVLFHIPQKFIRVSPTKKPQALLEILEKDLAKKKKILIFSNKATTSDFVQIFLKENNIPCVFIKVLVCNILGEISIVWTIEEKYRPQVSLPKAIHLKFSLVLLLSLIKNEFLTK